MREESLDHVLLYGPPGLGKTTLAGIIANELNVNFRITSGPAIEKPGDLAALLTNLNPGRRALHRRGAPPVAQRGGDPLSGDGGLCAGHHHRQGADGGFLPSCHCPSFTLVGATTRAGHSAAPRAPTASAWCCGWSCIPRRSWPELSPGARASSASPLRRTARWKSPPAPGGRRGLRTGCSGACGILRR